MTRILFYLDDYPHDIWRQCIHAIDPTVEFMGNPDWGSPDDGDAYAFVWEPEPGLIARYPNIKAVFSLGAGVDHLTRDPDLPKGMPIIRMGDEGLKEGMAEYVLMNVLMHHRQTPQLLAAQRQRHWKRVFSLAAKDVRVGILGYGALGQRAAQALKPLGYNIAAWSRSPKDDELVTHFTGMDQLNDFLARTDILVGLLPSTKETEGLLDFDRLSRLPEGASVINAGRGSLIVLDDLMALLDSGYISGASLDVFPEEPLPADHPLWGYDTVLITPHSAAITRPDTAADYVLRNIKRIENGEEPENLLDTNLGY
ncbi:2-hydroxyacid dehydrogenase [Kordiimonas lacus]|uniref:Glyoxylate/hydroxypyruvate reductase A n=1 Tax=Kordiimonas lacus TaxID=637679 RepID=A0A1G7DJ39_9PROT|nr:glyoxylate/hydroxypyruvate reductase A [Kordiimonas lacus]SDE51554.1 glyoxylate/hydroxypyruvate reductase A [Kordiimonas lacus]